MSWRLALTEAGVTLHLVRPDDWQSHRDLRLEMLLDAPDAFLTQHADVVGLDESGWRARIAAQHHIQARIGGEAVGSVGLFEDPAEAGDTLTLVAMYVTPRARGLRVGARLVQAVLDEALARGRDRVVLEVTSRNAPAIRLYERMGFRSTGQERPDPRRPGLSDLRMCCAPMEPGTRMRDHPSDLPG